MQETCVQHKTLLGGKRGIPIYPPSKPSHRPKGRQHWGLWISNRPKAVPKPSQNALGRPKRRETVLILCPEAGRQDSCSRQEVPQRFEGEGVHKTWVFLKSRFKE